MVGTCHHSRWKAPHILRAVDSDIVHATALGTHIIILNSAKAVYELFEKRSSIYSDRWRILCLYSIEGC